MSGGTLVGFTCIFSCAPPTMALVGGCAIFSLRSVACFAFGRWERRPLGMGQECFESGPRVGQERVKSGPILGELDYACNQWWVKGRSRAGPERVNSGPCMAPEWAEHRSLLCH